jgi:hypothetical protein
MKLINKFTVSTKKEKRTKKERNGYCYSSLSFNSFCPASGVHPSGLRVVCPAWNEAWRCKSSEVTGCRNLK